MRLQAKIEQERRAQSRLESLKEGALEVKEQRGVIMDLKHQLKQQEIQENKMRKEEVRSIERDINEKLNKRKEEVLRSV
jgi:phenylalanyl-tRNA synthetase alpha subunit